MQPPNIRTCFDLHGTTVTIRTMAVTDRKIEAEFVRNLSDESRYYRFHSALKELTPDLLERFTHVNYPDNMALIATIQNNNEEQQIGVARYAKYPERNEAEVAIVVADAWQGQHLGRQLLVELRNVAVDAGISGLHMSVLASNHRMIKLAHELGYHTAKIPVSDITRELGKPVSPKPSKN